MGAEERPGLLDRLVESLARLVDGAGFRGNRVRWRWARLKGTVEEGGLRALLPRPGAGARHRVCPECGALAPRASWSCAACGASLAHLRLARAGRALEAILPGATTGPAALLLVNVALFLLVLLAPAERGEPSELARLVHFDGATLLRYGAGASWLTFGQGEWWRLVTPVFLHGGLLHLLFNSLVLLQLGPLVEEEYGTERFLVLYLACGIGGNVASQGLRSTVTVGASSAIVGLMGLLLVYGWRRGGVFGTNLRKAMATYAFYVLLMSLLPGVDLLSHAGGFASGAALGSVVPPGAFRSRGAARLWAALAAAGVALVLFSFYRVARSG